jgi:hypothetical protein
MWFKPLPNVRFSHELFFTFVAAWFITVSQARHRKVTVGTREIGDGVGLPLRPLPGQGVHSAMASTMEQLHSDLLINVF